MNEIKWNVNDLLSEGESIIFSSEVEEENGTVIQVCLTNYRIIWTYGEVVDCRLLKFISKHGMKVGFETYYGNYVGTGEYGVYFGYTGDYELIWFSSQDECKEFHDKLSEAII